MNWNPKLCLGVSTFSVVFELLVLPTFSYPQGDTSYFALPGTILAVVGALTSAFAFLKCSILNSSIKFTIALIFIFQTWLAVEFVMEYVAFGLNHG